MADYREKDRAELQEPGYNATKKRKAESRMAMLDALPRELRLLAHEIGHEIVFQFHTAGITRARTIKHLIAVVRGVYPDGRPSIAPNRQTEKRNPLSGDWKQ